MIHPSDEDLLELALAGDDADVRGHVTQCAECRARFDAVEREQALIASAFSDVALPDRLRDALTPRPARWPWAVVAAAALLLGTTTFFAARADHWHREAARLGLDAAALRPAPEAKRAEPEESRWKLRNVAHQVSEKRSEGQVPEFARDLGDMRAIVIDSLGSFVELTDDQRHRMDELMGRLTNRMLSSENAATLALEYHDALKEILTAEQFAEIEKWSAAEGDWARTDAIEMVIDELAAALDLRHSEGERLREALDASYPATGTYAPFLMANPSDPLLDNPRLAQAVRGEISAAYHTKFDAYLKNLAAQRTFMEKAMKERK
jgi:hypothetical protein